LLETPLPDRGEAVGLGSSDLTEAAKRTWRDWPTADWTAGCSEIQPVVHANAKAGGRLDQDAARSRRAALPSQARRLVGDTAYGTGTMLGSRAGMPCVL